MEPTAHPQKTALPGVGVRFDLTTDSGDHLSVVIRYDGRIVLGVHDPDDDDACKDAVNLTAAEGATLAKLLTLTDPVASLRQEMEIDLVTGHIPVTARSPYAGRTLGDTRARTRTGSSIVAVVRRTAAVPSPTPDFRLASGDKLVVVGTREGVDAVADLIAKG
jgi:TrkA domain protein